MSEYRNYAIAMVLSVAVLFAWQYFYQQPLIEQERARQEAIQQQQQIQAEQQTQTGIPAPQTPDGVQTPTVAPGAATAPTGVQIPPATPGVALREATIAATERITIDTAELSGSINLTGARLDDLRLKEFRETVDPDSPIITLLSPTGASNPYFIETGWVVAQGTELTMPGRETVWQAEGASTLTETQPVTLVWESPEGLVFRRTISVDDHYLFTVEQQVTNRTGEAVTLFPYGLISRHGTPETTPFFILHEG
ncbi:MAG: membrane protein insertase YidC, partial [Hyphomicrobiales bacterium]|nr:membrane protein insertase YidC [Hyphomicrobiales bacterium]